MNIILLGPQGSGKGTQAQLLSDKYKLKHISTGDVIRQGIANKDPDALQLKEHIDKGGLAPDEWIMKLVSKNLSENGNLFDGIPRTLPQAEALDEITEINLVIELTLSDEEAIKRISSRRQCKDCKAVFGPGNPPREEGKCNRCGGELYQRDDDKPEAIKKRLTTYHDETEPLLEYYKPRNITHSVDGSKTVEEVFKALCKVIDSQTPAV